MSIPLGSANSYLKQIQKDDYKKSHFLYFSIDEPKVRTGQVHADGIRRLSCERKSDNSFLTNVPDRTTSLCSVPNGTNPEWSVSTGSTPRWLVLDGVILRFFSYCHEGPIESRTEEMLRIRYFEIFFYMEDETVMIMEQKNDRAGMKQGKFLNRQRVPRQNDSESHLNIFDLNVKNIVSIFARQHFIYRCDPFTRATMQKMGVVVPDDTAPPFSQHLLDAESEKRSNHRLRRHINEHHHLERFLQHDTEVLRFYAYWDDREKLFGDRHSLVIHHFLCDQTTEILRKIPMAYGKEKLEPFVRRSKIPKNLKDFGKAALGSPWPVLNIVCSDSDRQGTSRLLFDQAQFDEPPETYTEVDFHCGATINIFSKPVFIYNCDAYTTWFYKKIYGFEMKPENVEEPVNQKLVKRPPPYNGYGSEEDSLRNCAMLVPKPPILDVRKCLLLDWDEGDPEKLIFRLKMATQIDKNKNREFIMSFSPSDNSLYIYEKNVPQGVMAGNFHGKKAVKKGNDSVTDLPEYIQAEDFFVGREFQFHQHPFIVVQMDECTAKFMEKYPHRFPFSDPIKITEKFRKIVQNSLTTEDQVPLKHRFEAADPTHTGIIDWDTFVTLLMNVGKTQLNPHEYLTIARHYKFQNSADKKRRKQLFCGLIQNHFRHNVFDCNGKMMPAFIRADPANDGFLSRADFVRVVKTCRAPINFVILNLFLDLTICANENQIDYKEVISEWDWINNPSNKLSDIPQNVGKNFDFEKYFGHVVPSVCYKNFLMDINELN